MARTSTRVYTGGKRPRSRGDRVFDTVNLALLFAFLVTIVYPLLYIVSASFSNPAAVVSGEMVLWPVGFNLEAYQRVFAHTDIWRSYLNSLLYTVAGTALSIVLTILAAYPLSRKDMKGRMFFTIFFTITMFFSGGVVPTFLVVKGIGIYNTVLAIILPRAITVYNIIILRSYFDSSIPWEIQEAGIIDGCSNMRLLRRVVVPLSGPVLAVLLLFYGVAAWNAYFDAMMYVTNRSLFPLSLIIREILIKNSLADMVQSGSNAAQIMQGQGVKYAVIIVSTLPVLVAYPFLQKYFLKGLMVGAVKG